VISPALIFLLRIALAIWLFCFFVLPYEFEDFFFYFCEKSHWDFDEFGI
jgi:hypothetical protein